MSPAHADEPLPRSLLWLSVVLVLVALGIRCYHFAGAGIDHYDEGVYALSADGVAHRFAASALFPRQERFSPPLYFGLGALLKALVGIPADRALIAWSMTAGTATVALVCAVGWRWVSAGAGLAAAALLALSEYHVTLSRSALTDATFALLELGAVFVLAEALERKKLRLALLGGILTGLAWNTKYHGWFALVVTALALLPRLWSERKAGLPGARALLMPWITAAAVAGAVYLPWALYVQAQPGGYASLVALQRGMLRPHWIHNLIAQVSQQRFFDGTWSAAASPIAFGLALLARGTRSRMQRTALALAVVSTAALAAGSAVALPLLALFGAATLLPNLRDIRAASLLAWLALWTVMTPLYRPYARLYLPLAIGLILVAGATLDALARRLVNRDGSRGGIYLSLAGAGAVVLISLLTRRGADPWRPRRGAAEAAHRLATLIPPGARVLVLDEPSVAFYLGAEGISARERVGALELGRALQASPQPVWVVVGYYSRHVPADQHALDALKDQLKPLATVPFSVGDLRLLDDHPAKVARRLRGVSADEYALQLFRSTP